MSNIKKIFHTRSKEFFSLCKSYSPSYALFNLTWWFCFYIRPPFCYKLSTYAIKKKTAWLNKYIERKYKHIIDRHTEGYTYCNTETRNKHPHIWVFWGQGEQDMPPLVRACYKQLTRNNDVTLVTNNNINEYINLPQIIFDKIKLGKISWANYSDIIRNKLLAEYGGLWLDATVWVNGKIPLDKLNKLEIFSANGKVLVTPRSTRFWTSFEHNWSTWCLWSKKNNNILYSFVSEMLIAIAEQEEVWPDYVIQDYLIYYATQKFPVVNTMISDIHKFPCDRRNTLASIMNKKYDEKIYKELVKDNYFFKLSFRADWQEKTKEGKTTFYGKLIFNHQN